PLGCSVGSLFNAPPTKVIDVTPSRVVDSALEGSSETRSTALVLSSARGDAPPPWTAHQAADAPWLTIGAGTGSAPDTLQLALDPTDLPRSEEHTSELQSLRHLVCRLLLEKKKKK